MRIVLLAFIGILVIARAGRGAALDRRGRRPVQGARRARAELRVGRYGRFGAYLLGADLALDHPFGIGPLQFAKLYVEDPPQHLLNAFMSGGWLSGFCYLTLTAVTVVKSTRFLLVRTPWQPIYHAVYAAYLGIVAESAIIESTTGVITF